MKVRRFFAPDMSAAMRMVREEVGSDAVILSNSSVAGGVEVVVALEYPETPRPNLKPVASAEGKPRHGRALVGMPKPSRLQAELGRTRSALASSRQGRDAGSSPYLKAAKDGQLGLDDAVWEDVLAALNSKKTGQSKPVPPTAPQSRPEPDRADADSAAPIRTAAASDSGFESTEQQALRAMRNEIDELKALLRTRLAQPAVADPAPVAAVNSARERIFKRLRRMNIEARLAERLVQAIEVDTDIDRAWKIALSRLAEALPVVAENIAERGGILAFVGTTGVGKTTTIGKLAAQYVLKHGSSGVALVTTDCYRIAAHEQLRTFGRILDIPVRVVDEKRSLDETLHGLRDKRLVLVDTAGLSTSASQREQQLAMLSASSYRIKKFAVLPCTAQYRILRRGLEQLKSLGLNGAVLSKVDESVSLGEAISLVVEQRLPVAYLGDGQKIPDNIEVARANAIVSRAVILAETQARIDKSRPEPDDDALSLYTDNSRVG